MTEAQIELKKVRVIIQCDGAYQEGSEAVGIGISVRLSIKTGRGWWRMGEVMALAMKAWPE